MSDRECLQRFAGIIAKLSVDLSGRKVGTIQKDLGLDKYRIDPFLWRERHVQLYFIDCLNLQGRRHRGCAEYNKDE